MLNQRTLASKVTCTGVGLHTGRQVNMEVLPAPVDNGITFVRTNVPGHPELRACIKDVADTTMATTLAVGVNGSRATVGTVEHLLAAFWGLGIDNARVLLDEPEVPAFDGSAAPFVSLLQSGGIEMQRLPKRFLVIKREVKVAQGDKQARIGPGEGLRVTCSLDFDHPLIPPTPFRFEFSERAFQRELARARTFGFLKDVEALRTRGLAQGGSLENAVVIDGYRVLNPEGLRYPDEFVRHKILDAIGDLSLLGTMVVGHLHLHRSGHALNTDLVREILSDARNYEIVEPAQAEMEQARRGEWGRFPVLEPVESAA